jgi:hypothetical protein
MDDDLGMQVVKHALYLGTVTELVVVVPKRDDLCSTAFLQFLVKVGAKEALAPRNNNPLVGQIKHSYFVSFRTLSSL